MQFMQKSSFATRVLHSESLNPWFNLATEDWIFRDMNPDGHVLFLWRNSETVVIGRYQNPWAECRLEVMKDEGVKLARRQSGGGAVYHDPGNLNFTFMSGRDIYDKQRNFEIIIDALGNYGIEAETSGRNDLIVNTKKISGSAFKLTRDRAFHHGTLLVDVDLGRLTNYLNPDARKLESKGVKSVKSRVANLKEYNPGISTDELAEVITKSFFSRLGRGSEEVLNLDSLKNNSGITNYFNILSSEDWLYGKSPDFTHRIDSRFSWGGMDIRLDVRHGKIRGIEIFTDCMHPELVEGVKKLLTDLPYSPDSIQAAITELEGKIPEWDPVINDIEDMLMNEFHG